MVAGAGPWQDERAAPGSGVVGCRRRWAEQAASRSAPRYPPSPGLPRPGDGLVVLYRPLLLIAAQSWLTGAAQGRGGGIQFF